MSPHRDVIRTVAPCDVVELEPWSHLETFHSTSTRERDLIVRQATAVWSGVSLLLFGGVRLDETLRAATWSYAPQTDAWAEVDVPAAPPARAAR